jgi:hypothetical protein
VGQQAAALHGLSHAIQSVQSGSQDQHPGNEVCNKCSVFAPFGGAAPAFLSALVVASDAVPSGYGPFLPAPARTVVTALSRAPPSVL